MINIGAFAISPTTAVMAAIAVSWLLAVLLAAILPAKKKLDGLRRVDLFVVVLTIAFGIAWFAGIVYPMKQERRTTRAATKRERSCVSVEAGQTESKVRALLGEPDEIRPEEDVRGPGSDVWIYRDSRCAVHTMMGTVIAVE